MANITTRETGGTAVNRPLTNAELDNNFINLNTDIGTRIPSTEKGSANGVASLDATGKVPTAQLPSYVDDVLEAANLAAFPATGETGKIYVALDTNKTYRWSGSAYVYITSGAVDSVAGKTGVVTLVKGDVGLGSVDNTADSAKNVLSATKLTTARTIGGVSFDGTANINLPGVNAAGNQNTTGTAAGLTDNSSWMLNRGSVAAASVDTATLNGFYTQNNVGDSQGLLVFNAGGSLGPLQMTFTYSGLMQFRGKTDSTTWTPWKTVVTSANVSSYALPIGGGTLTGQYLDFSNSTPSLRITSGPGTFFIGDDDLVNLSSGALITTPHSRVVSGVAYFSTYAYGVSQGDNKTHFGYYNGTSYLNYIRGAGTYFDSATLQIAGNQALHAGNYNSYSPTLTGGGASGSWGISVTGSSASTTGNAATATTLQTARTLTIGSTGKTFNGSANVAWSLAEIGAGTGHVYGYSATYNVPAAMAESWFKISDAYNGVVYLSISSAYDNTMHEDHVVATVFGYNMKHHLSSTTSDYNVGKLLEIKTNNNGSAGTTEIWVRFGSAAAAGSITIKSSHTIPTLTPATPTFGGTGIVSLLFDSTSRTTSSLLITRGIRIDGNLALHAGNYNSYSPTLTGTGASGSWGISITGSSASTTGNAATATALQTARTINGVSFNGSANITVADATKLPLTGGTMTGAIAFAAGQTWPTFNQNTTGSAASVAWTGVTGKPTLPASQEGNRYSTDFNTILSTGFFNAAATPTNSPGGSYGQLIAARGIDTGLQIYGGYTNDSLWFRGWHSSGTFTSWRTVLHSGNYNSYSPTLTGTGASGSWGISITGSSASISGFNNPATAATANTIAYRTADGDLAVRELIMGAAVQSFTPSSLVAIFPTTNQAVKVDAAGARAFLDVPTKAGSGASGSWGISITGTATNASQLGGISSNRAILKRRARIHSADSTSLNSSITAPEMGFTYGGSGEPAGPFIAFGGLGGDIDYSMQLAGAYAGSGNDFKIRTYNGDSSAWNAWRTIITDGNYTSYSPSLTGSGASGTWGISVTGNAATATVLQTARTINGVSFNGSANITVADSTKLPLSGGTLTGQVTINAVGTAGSPTLRLNTSSSATFVHVQENLAAGLTTGQHAVLVVGREANTKNSGYIGYHWAGAASNSNYVTIGHWGADALFRVYGDGNVTVGANAVLHAGNYNSYSPTLTGTGASGSWGISVTGSSASTTGNAATATNISNTGTVTLASATESNSIFITAPSYTTDAPVKLLNFDWYGNVFSMGNIRSGATPTNGFGVYYTPSGGSRSEIARFNTNGTLRTASGLQQGPDMVRPLAQWSATGAATGMVYFEMPGNTTSNYGMVHAVIDIYEYNSNAVSTIIVGGHNWNGAWYNVAANVIGQTDKAVRLAVRGGKYVICIGSAGSSWSYGTVVLRKIHNGGYYTGIMDMSATFVAAITTTESLTSDSGDLRALRTPSSFNAGGAITQAGNQVLHAGNYNSYSPTLTGTGASGSWGISVTGSSASTTGNAATATALQTARTIGGVSFNGTANINLPGVNAAGNQSTTGNAATATALQTARTIGGVSFNGTANINLPGVNAAGNQNTSGTATNATNTTITNDTTTTTAQFVTFVGASSGNTGQKTHSTGLTFIPSTGALTASGNITAYSDESLKKDWAPVATDFVVQLASIKHGTYTRIDSGERQAGASAQDWQKLLPETVLQGSDGKLSLAYGNAALVSAIQLAQDNLELRARIDRLESLIEQILNKE